MTTKDGYYGSDAVENKFSDPDTNESYFTLVNEKTGVELVWEWLEKHDVAKYIDEVTHEKPRAEYYIDDKGIKFENKNFWEILLLIL